MSKWNLIVNVGRCENCYNCVISERDEHVGNDFPGYAAPAATVGESTIRILRRVRGQPPMIDVVYLPVMCNHCDDAPCQKAAPEAVRKRDDGLVIIDPNKAQGRRDIVDACPYGAVVWNEEKRLPQNWIFDAHLLDAGWKQPRLCQVCPTDVFEAAKLDDQAMAERVQREKLRPLRSERGAKPRVWYRGLERWETEFVGGSVAADADGVVDCVQGVDVALLRNGVEIAQTQTDSFGDFRFDGLRAQDDGLEIEVRHTAGAIRRAVKPSESRYLGEILLKAKRPEEAPTR